MGDLLGSIGSAISSVASPLISGGLGLLGGVMNNNANANQAQVANQFSAQQAQDQMNFQQEMSNTSYQRGTADMEAAGLNPMLAYSQGGASVPTGAMAVGQQAQMQNVALPAIQAYNNTAQTAMQQAKNPSEIANTIQNTKTSSAHEYEADAREGKTRTETDVMIKKLGHEIKLLDSQRGVNSAVEANTRQTTTINQPDADLATSGFTKANKVVGESATSAKKVRDVFNPLK
jgi:hypothetical protein